MIDKLPPPTRGTIIYGLWADVHGTPEHVRWFRENAAVRWAKEAQLLGQMSVSFFPEQYTDGGFQTPPFIFPEPMDRASTLFGIDAPCVAGDCGGGARIFTRLVAFLGGNRTLRENVCLYFYEYPAILKDEQAKRDGT